MMDKEARIKKQESRGRKGFTLLEVVVAIGISAVIVLSVGNFTSTISNVGNLISGKLQADQDLGIVFSVLTSEIRSMSPSSGGAYAIEFAASSSLTFFSDIDRDGLFDRVRYFFGTSTLQKGVVRPTGNPLTYVTSTEIIISLIPNVIATGTLFSYYDSAYTGTQSPLASTTNVSNIRVIRVLVTSDANASSSPRPLTLDAFITPRNLRTN